MNELAINPKQYDLPESKAQELETVFSPFIEVLKTYEERRNELLGKEVTKELSTSARTVRLEVVKLRTGIDKAHKAAKEESRKTGLAIDGWKNLLLRAIEPVETDLEKIEKHFEIQEAERKAKLQAERQAELSKYNIDCTFLQLGEMNDQVWESFLLGQKTTYEAKIAAEKKAEEDRIAREKAEAEERERIRIENEKLKAEAIKREKEAEAERKKQAAILAKQKAEADAKQKAIEDQLKKERAEADAERKRIEAENQKRIDAEKKERERLQNELRAKQEAEAKENLRLQQEQKARELTEKKAAMAPDKDKLNVWINSLELSEVSLKDPKASEMAEDIRMKFKGFKNWAMFQINSL